MPPVLSLNAFPIGLTDGMRLDSVLHDLRVVPKIHGKAIEVAVRIFTLALGVGQRTKAEAFRI